MSITTVNAKIYIARVIGGANSSAVLDLAGEALLRGYQDWQAAKFWRFLLKDTSVAPVHSCKTTSGSTTVDHVAQGDGNIDFINVGMTCTSANWTGTATVLSYTRHSDGTIHTFEIDKTANTTGNVDITFSADIPIKQSTNEYNLPTDFYAPYTAKFTGNPKTLLTFRDHRHWDRILYDQSTEGTPREYTVYNPVSALTQNFGVTRLRFDRIPSADNTLRLRYYRKFTTDGANVDMPDELLYAFLDYCRSLVLELKRAQDDPSGYRQSVLDAFEQMKESDEEPTDDNDDDMCMKSQYEMGPMNYPLWNNGDFDITR